jgi:hypothetical protein
MKRCNLVWCVFAIATHFVPFPCLLAQKVDPATAYLNSQGLSNIPPANQNDALLGTLIWVPNARNTENNFESPDPATPSPRPTPLGVYIPGGKVQELVDGGAEASFLGFSPSAEFQTYKNLTYSALPLLSKELTIGQVRDLLAKGGYTDKLAMKRIKLSKKKIALGVTVRTGINDTAVQFVIGKVFTTTTDGDITADEGTVISAKSGGDIPTCTYLTPPSDAVPKQDGQKPVAPAADKQTANGQAQGAPSTPNNPSAPSASDAKPGQTKPGAANQPQSVIAQLGQDATQIVGDLTGSGSTTKVDTSKAVKAVTSTVASGGVHYCRKDSRTVHFEAAHPFPVAMYLYQLFLDDDQTWDPSHKTLTFVAAKPLVVH